MCGQIELNQNDQVAGNSSSYLSKLINKYVSINILSGTYIN